MNKSVSQQLRRAARDGFTLIEILLVVVIIGILAAVAVPNLAGKVGKAQTSAAKQSIAAIESAIDMYEVDNGRFPDSLQNLVTKGNEPNWSGPYIKKAESLNDPWGTQFQYTKSENSYTLSSAGPDMAFGTADDVK